jgi:hypothetical protein
VNGCVKPPMLTVGVGRLFLSAAIPEGGIDPPTSPAPDP